MLFCPTCANLLTLSGTSGTHRWACPTCPYEFPITTQFTTRKRLQRKVVDDVMGGEESWKNVDKCDTPCPKCEAPQSYWMQLQIRSADEPMTTFYRCVNPKCSHQWREN